MTQREVSELLTFIEAWEAEQENVTMRRDQQHEQN